MRVTQSCLILCNPMDPWNSLGQNTGVGSLSLLQGTFPIQGSNPGLPHCRRILYQLSHKGSLRILEWVAYPFLQWIFLTQKSNWCLLHYRQILYQLSYLGKPLNHVKHDVNERKKERRGHLSLDAELPSSALVLIS